VLIAFSVAPSGVGDSVTEAVADAVTVVRESGLPNHTDAMFTTIEGDWLVLKADIRPGWTGELEAKVDRLEAAIERTGPAGP
jgi:uncharacterized protein YqgV (UPF0045/DUF77 family)